jgi:hypothetical protein
MKIKPKMKCRKQRTAYTAFHMNAGRKGRQEDHTTPESPNTNATQECEKYASPK